MKKLALIGVMALGLSACSDLPSGLEGVDGVLFGAAAVALCAQSGVCAFPL